MLVTFGPLTLAQFETDRILRGYLRRIGAVHTGLSLTAFERARGDAQRLDKLGGLGLLLDQEMVDVPAL